MSFCGCCSAEALIAGGRLDDAERELARTLQIVEETGTRGRCVDPRARLADLLVRQGRLEEAEQILPGADGDGWTIRARAELHLARGEPAAAAVVLERRLRQIGVQSLLAVTVLDLLVQARLAEGNLAAATRRRAHWRPWPRQRGPTASARMPSGGRDASHRQPKAGSSSWNARLRCSLDWAWS
jgi:hypothetical protein